MGKIITNIYKFIFAPISYKEFIGLTLISPILGLLLVTMGSSIAMPDQSSTTHAYVGLLGFVFFPPLFFIFNLTKVVRSPNKGISDIDYYQDVEDSIPANNECLEQLKELDRLYVEGSIDIPTYNERKRYIIKNHRYHDEQ